MKSKNPLLKFRESTIPVMSAVLLVCTGVCLSAYHNYTTLRKLEYDYLRNQAANIATAVEFLGRGMEVSSSEALQTGLEEILSSLANPVAEVSIISPDSTILASSNRQQIGRPSQGQVPSELFLSKKAFDERREDWSGSSVYRAFLPVHIHLISTSLVKPSRNQPNFYVLAISLYVNSAEFISRGGKINLILTFLASGFLISISVYYLLAWKKALKLEAGEAEQRQWAALGRMSATLAHDIRTPLGAIKGLAQLLTESVKPSEPTNCYLQTIVQESQRLERLVSDLLLFAKPKRAHPLTFSLGDLMQDVQKTLEPRLRQSQVQIQVSQDTQPVKLNTDYDLFRRVLINLLENSLQAMPHGGLLHVSGELDTSKKAAVIRVEDEGEGLPVEAGKIFEPFYTTRASGTGLGLAICRQIIDVLGGTITVQNRKPQGAACTILLPARGLP